MHSSSAVQSSVVRSSVATSQGKSTLATAFHRQGFQLLSDDCLLLEQRDGGVQAVPAYPSLRLWPDSVEALLDPGEIAGERMVEMAHYTNKKQLLVETADMVNAGQSFEVSTLFLLDEAEVEDEIRIELAGGKMALITLIEDTFALDVVGRDAVRRGFELAGQIAVALPVYRLGYPRDYRKLSQVIARLTEF